MLSRNSVWFNKNTIINILNYNLISVRQFFSIESTYNSCINFIIISGVLGVGSLEHCEIF
jgi:hypothetical protein